MDKAIWKYSPLAENPSSGVVDFPSNGITTVIIELTGRFMHWMQMGSDNFNSGQSPDRLLEQRQINRMDFILQQRYKYSATSVLFDLLI